MKIVLTCEHGGNQIPPEYAEIFQNHHQQLLSHEGYDIGALKLAKFLAENLADRFYYSEVSRLLVELNRSLHNPRLFSAISKALPKKEQARILQVYYHPYRNEVFECIQSLIQEKNFVVHLSIHSFTPVFNDEVRNADIGLLFDPKRKCEQQFCRKWKHWLNALSKDYKTRFNYPYQGKADGLVTFLRKHFDCDSYVGIELEVNQKLLKDDDEKYFALKNLILESLAEPLNQANDDLNKNK